MHRFFLPPERWSEPFQLGGAEALHLAKVLRLKVGARVELLDGQGRLGSFAVAAIEKGLVRLQPEKMWRFARREARYTLAMGYNKGLRRSWLLEKSVEMEADALWFWQAERTQGRMPEFTADHQEEEKWKGPFIAGAKQCGNPWLPELQTKPGGVKDLAAARQGFTEAYVLWEEAPTSDLLTEKHLANQNAIFVLGPEGGINKTEMGTLRKADFMPLSLGPTVLRWETAALLIMNLCWWKRLELTNPPPTVLFEAGALP